MKTAISISFELVGANPIDKYAKLTKDDVRQQASDLESRLVSASQLPDYIWDQSFDNSEEYENAVLTILEPIAFEQVASKIGPILNEQSAAGREFIAKYSSAQQNPDWPTFAESNHSRVFVLRQGSASIWQPCGSGCHLAGAVVYDAASLHVTFKWAIRSGASTYFFVIEANLKFQLQN